MNVRIDRRPDEIICTLEGEIDLANVAVVDAEINDGLDDRSRVVVDLTATSYIDSAGLRMLFALARKLGGRLTIVLPESSPLRRVITMVGLARVAALVETLPDQA